MKRPRDQRVDRFGAVLAGKLFHRDAGGKAAVTGELNAVVKDRDSDIAGVVGVVAVHDGVENDFPEDIQRDREAVLAEYLSGGVSGGVKMR